MMTVLFKDEPPIPGVAGNCGGALCRRQRRVYGWTARTGCYRLYADRKERVFLVEEGPSLEAGVCLCP